MSEMDRLQDRRDEIVAEMVVINATAASFNRAVSAGELVKRDALEENLAVIGQKIEDSRTAEELRERSARATPAGLFGDFY